MYQHPGATIDRVGRSVSEIATKIPGAWVVGNGTIAVTRLVHPAHARTPEELFPVMDGQVARAVISGKILGKTALVEAGVWKVCQQRLEPRLEAAIVVPRTRYALAKLGSLFPRRGWPRAEVHPRALVDPTAVVGEGCHIAAGAVIGAGAVVGAGSVVKANAVIEEGAVLGEKCLVHPGVFIGDRVELGARVVVHPNAVVGSDGFAFETERKNVAERARRGNAHLDDDGQLWERIESHGTVRVGDDVEIGAGATIDRAAFGETVVGDGVKIDNLVHIGHNCRIGRNSLLCAQVGIAGSSAIGEGCVLAGKVGVADHVKIGDHTVVMAKSGVTHDLAGNAVYYGMPARPVKETLRIFALQGKLQEIWAAVRRSR